MAKKTTVKANKEKPITTTKDISVPDCVAEINDSETQHEAKVYDHTQKTLPEVFGLTETDLEKERLSIISEAVGMKRSQAVEYIANKISESENSRIYAAILVTGLLFK